MLAMLLAISLSMLLIKMLIRLVAISSVLLTIKINNILACMIELVTVQSKNTKTARNVGKLAQIAPAEVSTYFLE